MEKENRKCTSEIASKDLQSPFFSKYSACQSAKCYTLGIWFSETQCYSALQILQSIFIVGKTRWGVGVAISGL